MHYSQICYHIKSFDLISKDCLLTNNPFMILNDGVSGLRKKSLEFHIKEEDYFGTLATILDIIRQDKVIWGKMTKNILGNICDDLSYLQDNYRIIKK